MDVRPLRGARRRSDRRLPPGRADSAGISTLETRFYAVVTHSKGPAIVDLLGVPFVASLGIRMFVMAAKSLSKHGVPFVLHSAPELVVATLRDAGIDAMIPIAADRTGAVESVQRK